MTPLEQLTATIVDHGLAGADLAVARTVAHLRGEGRGSVALDVLADPREPEVARLRALSVLQRRAASAISPAADPVDGGRHDTAA